MSNVVITPNCRSELIPWVSMNEDNHIRKCEKEARIELRDCKVSSPLCAGSGREQFPLGAVLAMKGWVLTKIHQAFSLFAERNRQWFPLSSIKAFAVGVEEGRFGCRC